MLNFIKKTLKVIGYGFLGMLGLSVFLAVVLDNDKPSNQAQPVAQATLPPPPKGWDYTGTPGIYCKWCTNCKAPEHMGSAQYTQLKVWCKDRDCGDIYARVNLLDRQGTVVGWTNDTAYGSMGQKVVLTFRSYQEAHRVELTEMKFY